MYLILFAADHPQLSCWPTHSSEPVEPTSPVYHYPLADDGRILIDCWQFTLSNNDAQISGILADWLEEHRSDLLSGATGPTDPAVRLDQLIAYLRNRWWSMAGKVENGS